jgi:hypothetical protein
MLILLENRTRSRKYACAFLATIGEFATIESSTFCVQVFLLGTGYGTPAHAQDMKGTGLWQRKKTFRSQPST